MTIGIGVLATSERGRQKDIVPDSIVLIADTMGSFGDVDSYGRLHKVITMPEHGLYAAIAGEVDKGAELLPVIATFVEEIPKEKKSYGKIMAAIAAGCFQYKHEKFVISEFPKLRLRPELFDPLGNIPPDLNLLIQKQWEEFYVGCDLIIGAFDKDGRAYLFQVDGRAHEVRNVSFPGFGAIGSGADNALFWLSRRQHTLGLPLLRATYHAYEAKIMAEGSAHVNKHLDIILADACEQWVCTTHAKLTKEKEHPEINIKNMRRLFKKYGPRDTNGLGSK